MDDTSNRNEQECKLNGCLFFSSVKLARVLGNVAEDAFQKTGLFPGHALLLYIVNQRGNIHQKEIGELLHLTPSTITRFIEKLGAKGLVARKTDGKNVYIHMTDKGMLLQPEIEKSWNNLQTRYEDILTEDEITQFIVITGKLLRKLTDEKD